MLYDFNKLQENGLRYGGNAGSKLGVIVDGENWILKFPKSTKDYKAIEISYTTTPLSEYLGSHIYEIIGIDVHKTLLGERDGKIVVACIEEMKNRDCNEAILRVVPDINMNLIKNLIYSVENEYKEIKVTSDIQKEFYIKTLEYRYNKILLPTLEKLKSKI